MGTAVPGLRSGHQLDECRLGQQEPIRLLAIPVERRQSPVGAPHRHSPGSEVNSANFRVVIMIVRLFYWATVR